MSGRSPGASGTDVIDGTQTSAKQAGRAEPALPERQSYLVLQAFDTKATVLLARRKLYSNEDLPHL